MLIATVPYVGKRLHLDPDPEPDPDPKLNYWSGSEQENNFGSGRIRIHNPVYQWVKMIHNGNRFLEFQNIE